MAQRKPRSRKAAAPRRGAARHRVGPLWWGAGLLALGWIALDANRPMMERHVPQLAMLRLPWDAAETPPARQPAAPRRVAAVPDPARAAARPAEPRQIEPRKAEPRQAAVPARTAVPDARPPRPVPASASASAPAQGQAPAPASASTPASPPPAASAAPAGAHLVTRAPVPLRRAPRAGAPVWMVLDPGRPLRVTRREGGFARVESGIFTGWVDASVLPAPATRETPRPSAQPAPRAAMPTLAAAAARPAAPVPVAGVPGAGVPGAGAPAAGR
ncbi:hypothetical protein D3218_05140 [Aureimonas flava]|uniref:SH3 domain-containing protein n=1 Tax=Aureimonas flava TaxID=2320271 RepID=A0A3A1WNT9_9HYPH|nr:SH3 domain-containing protein [Aureimonas flava]RIY02739.1 hypothetical protein D3218_05140 [Aureimonas flava]